MLRGTVRCQKLAAHVDDGLVVPEDAHARLGDDLGDYRGFEVLLLGIPEELFHISGGDGASHALLALRDGELSAVKAVVFLRDLIEIDAQAVGDLAQGNRHATRAEVVAALDEAAGLAAAE